MFGREHRPKGSSFEVSAAAGAGHEAVPTSHAAPGTQRLTSLLGGAPPGLSDKLMLNKETVANMGDKPLLTGVGKLSLSVDEACHCGPSDTCFGCF